MLQKVNNKLMFSDGAYALGKKAVQVYIPAVSSLYFGLASIWGLPAVEQVVGTLAVVATFLGVCLGLSSKQYDDSGAALEKLDAALGSDGEMEVVDGPGGKQTFSLNLNSDPNDLVGKKTISFKVNPKK